MGRVRGGGGPAWQLQAAAILLTCYSRSREPDLPSGDRGRRALTISCSWCPAKLQLELPGGFCTSFVRRFKTFLQEKGASELRNDSLFNRLQCHRTHTESLIKIGASLSPGCLAQQAELASPAHQGPVGQGAPGCRAGEEGQEEKGP